MIFLYISAIGLIVGSFTSYLTYRLGRGEDILLSYSKCVKCGYRLKFYNLVPLFSWFIQRGKCSICKSHISIRYPVIEVFFALLFCLLLYINDCKVDYNLIFLLSIATIMVVMSIVDIEYYFIPVSTQIILLLLSVCFLLVNYDQSQFLIYRALSGIAFVVFGLFLYFSFLFFVKKEAIGVDDIKLFYTIGLLIGIENFVEFTFYTGFFGVIFGIFWTRCKKDDTFPFAPSILTSTFLCLIMEGRFELVDFLTKLIINYIIL